MLATYLKWTKKTVQLIDYIREGIWFTAWSFSLLRKPKMFSHFVKNKKMQLIKRYKGCSFNIMFFMNSAISVDDRSPYNGPACKTLTPREIRIQTSSHNNGTRVKIIFQNILKKHDIWWTHCNWKSICFFYVVFFYISDTVSFDIWVVTALLIEISVTKQEK